MIEVITPEDDLRIPPATRAGPQRGEAEAAEVWPPEDDRLPVTKDVCDGRLLAFMRRWSHRPEEILHRRTIRYVFCRFCQFAAGYIGLNAPRMMRAADGDHGTERICPEQEGL